MSQKKLSGEQSKLPKNSAQNKNRRRSKQNRSNSNSNKQFEEDFGTKETSASNKIEWYARNQELLRSAASLPFSQTLGQRVYVPDTGGSFVVPGVLSIAWIPALGITGMNDNGTPLYGSFPPSVDALNQAANSVYSFVVHANSRNTSYDAPDLLMVILAGGNVFSAIAMGIRVFGLMHRYDQQNLYTPRALVEACGFDFEDLQANLSKMWFDINNLVAMSSQIWIPNEFPLFERWFWMNTNVYADAESAKSQFYLFAQRRFYQFSETSSSQGTALTPIEWDVSGTTSHTWDQYVSMVRTMIDALLGSQDRGIMFGDILKAYGPDKIYALSEVPINYTTPVVFDREVLTQIENAQGVDLPLASDLGFQQNVEKGVILHRVTPLEASASLQISRVLPSAGVLNFHSKEVPTPEMVMVATRMKAMQDPSRNYGFGVPSVVGSELLTRMNIWVSDPQGKPKSVAFTSARGDTTTINEDWFKYWLAFDWAPWLYPVAVSGTAGNSSITYRMPLGEWDQYTVVAAHDLAEMHNAAIYSELGVPML
nr:putative capsid [Marmot picobirnavirus]